MKYFTIDELTASATARKKGIKNIPNDEERLNLIALVGAVLDPLRERYGKPINVSSGFRCRALNKNVGGVTGSQHCKGEAADIYSKEGAAANYELGRLIAERGMFDQLIFENVGKNDLLPKWIHVSWRRTGDNRQNILKKVKGKSGYIAVNRKELDL